MTSIQMSTVESARPLLTKNLEENIFAWVYIMRKEANKKKRGLPHKQAMLLRKWSLFGTHGSILPFRCYRDLSAMIPLERKVANISIMRP